MSLGSLQRLTIHLRTFLKVLSRHLSFPLRLVYRLFQSLLQLVSGVAPTRRFQLIDTNTPSDRVAGSSQSVRVTPQRNQLSVPSLLVPGPSSNPSLPILPLTTVTPSSNHAPAQPTSLTKNSTFEPFTPLEVMRYQKRPTIKPTNQSPIIQPLTRDYPDIQGGENWCARVHPEGALYFHDNARGIYTDSELQSQKRRSKINSCITELLALATSQGLHLTDDVHIELVVQLLRDVKSNAQICKYYFVDHPKRLLFWVHVQSGGKLFDGVQGVENMGQIKYAVEHQYWSHCEMYPNENLQGQALLKELREVVVHASAETITTDLCLSPFDGDELSKIMDLIGQLEGNVQDGCKAHSICVIARFMRYFARARFFNFYGLPTARLDADQSVYVKEKRNKLITGLSWAFNVALFGAPESHMRELRQVWVDRTIISPRWKNFNNQLSSEWSGITIYSTVMIAVDVSFLAVPSVMPSNTTSLPPEVVSTYISVFCIIGSLVVSLFLTRQNRHQESADKAVDFLMKMTGSAFGTRALATIHGLPYAMLLWGMVYFMLAFSYHVFTSTSAVALATAGSACGIVVFLTAWLVHAARDFHMSTQLIAWLRACRSRVRRTSEP